MTTKRSVSAAVASALAGILVVAPAAAQTPPASPTGPQQPSPIGPMMMAYLGLNHFIQGGGYSHFFGPDFKIDPGLRFGGLLGFYVRPWLTMNGELTLDFLNVNDPRLTGGERAALTFSPLFRLPIAKRLELRLGPKLGVWVSSISAPVDKWTGIGSLLGINAGVYCRAGNLLFGGLLTFESAALRKMCLRSEAFGCDYAPSGSGTEQMFGLSGSMIF